MAQVLPRGPCRSTTWLSHLMQSARLPPPVFAPKPPQVDRALRVRLAGAPLRAVAWWAPDCCAVALYARVAAAARALGSAYASQPAAAVPLARARPGQRALLVLAAPVQPDASPSCVTYAAQARGWTASPRNARAERDTASQPAEPPQRTAHAPGRRAPVAVASRYSRCTATRKCSAPAWRAASMACTTTPCEA